MTNCSCNSHTSSIGRKIVGGIKWIIPTTVLALIPKCPMCIAAYIAVATGFGISLSVATWIRIGLIATCICALACLCIRLVIRRFQVSRT